MEMLKDCLSNWSERAYVLFRVFVGFFFFQHGAMKVFGLFTDRASQTGIMYLFGWFEVLVGIAIFLGLMTRLAGLGGAVMMLLAYFRVHMPTGEMLTGLNLIGAGGEAVLLYLFAFLVIATHGPGLLSLERKMLGSDRF